MDECDPSSLFLSQLGHLYFGESVESPPVLNSLDDDII